MMAVYYYDRQIRRPMSLRRIAKRTLSDEVYEQLSGEIVEGRFGPGISLPAERQLCETLGVNRGA
ncbi:MAG: GntR family transcriptional regulator, partial [Deltaproteobacteria bacterium]|nr:GntR family transcriptional regulator [Deltaproteobacteria bacterium]